MVYKGYNKTYNFSVFGDEIRNNNINVHTANDEQNTLTMYIIPKMARGEEGVGGWGVGQLDTPSGFLKTVSYKERVKPCFFRYF